MGLTKAQLEALNISSFPNNTSELITPEILRTYNSASIANTVNQDAYTTDSASFNSRIDSIVTGTGFVTTSSFNAYTSSNDSKVNSLINATASYANSASVAVVNNAQQAQINSLIAFTGSNTNTSLNSYTASNDTKWSNLGAQTGSFITESETGSFATSAITASSLITASISGQTLTFTKGDASTFGVIIPTGSGGGTTDITSLNAFTASQLTINAGYNTTTASLLVETANLELFSASTLTRLTNIETTTASLNSSVTQLNANTASQQSQINSLISATASYAISSSVAAVDAAQQSQINSLIAATGSYSTSSVSLTSLNAYTQSNDIKWSNLGGQSGSWITESETASFARTNIDNNFTANQTFTNITAVSASFTYIQTLYETASVIYSSGSNQFGDELTDTQTLSGSVKVQGSLTINGTPVLTSSVDISGLTTTASFNAYTQSNNQRVSSLETNSASVNTSITNINSATASLFTSASLALTTASFSGNTLTFTKGDASTFGVVIPDVSGSTINTASFATTGSNTFIGDQTISGSLFVSGSEVLRGTLSASALRVENNTYLDGQLRVTNDAQFDTHILVQGAQPHLKLRDTSGGGFSSGYDIRIDTGSFEIHDDTHNRNVLSDFFNSASQQHTTSLTSEIIVISGSTSVTLIGNVSASIISASTINGLGDPLVFSTSVDSRLDSLEGVSGSFTTTASFNSYTSSTNSRLTNIESTTASLLIETQNLELFSASALSSISQLNASSASQQISINNLNTTTASLLIETQNLELFSASALTSLSNLNTATASLFTSTSLSLTTASFSGNTLTFRKGDGTTFGIVIPDISGSTIDTGSFATTGSNTFTGVNNFSSSVEILGGLNLYQNGITMGYPKQMGDPFDTNITISTPKIVGQSASGNNLILAGDTMNSKGVTILNSLGVTGSVVISKRQVGMSLTGGDLDVAGTFTASLQEGYAWVGGVGNISTLVATSSFGSTINTGSFATTGSNAFFGTNTFSGAVSFTGSAPSILSQSFSGSLITNLTDIYTDIPAVQQIVTLTSASYAALASGSLTNPNTLYIVSGSTSGGGTTDITALNAFTASQYVSNSFFATTGSNTFNGNQNISGSVKIGQTSGDTNNVYIDESGISLRNDTQTSINFNAPQTYFQSNGGFSLQNQIGGVGSGSISIEAKGGASLALTGSQLRLSGVDFIPFSASLNTRILAITGSGGTAFSNPNLVSNSGSLFIVANGVSSASANLSHISASAQNQSNLVFKNNENIGDTILSGSNNIFTNPASATTGYTRYIGGSNNLYLNSTNGINSQITASAASVSGVRPVMNNNIFNGTGNFSINQATNPGTHTYSQNIIGGTSNTTINALGFTGSLSVSSNFNNNGTITINAASASLAEIATGISGSGTLNIDQNYIAGGTLTNTSPRVAGFGGQASNNNIIAGGSITVTNISSSASVNTNNNITNGNISYTNANATAIHTSNGAITNCQGQITVNAIGSAVSVTNGVFIGGPTITNNSFTGSAGVGLMSANRNLFQGQGHTLSVTGSTETSTGANFGDNAILGRSVTIFSNQTGAGNYRDLNGCIIAGQNLIVSASNSFALTEGGSGHFGRYNANDGRRNKTGEMVFSVGTGISSARKTGFLIDSGSNTFIEGTLNVSGSSIFNGDQTITGSVNITGQYLINGVPISGGASINTGSFATTGSNTFRALQTINLSGTTQSLATSIVGNSTQVETDIYVDGGNYDTFNVFVSASNGVQLRDYNNASNSLKPFISVATDAGELTLHRNTNIKGNTTITGSLTVSGSTTLQGTTTFIDRSGTNNNNIYLGSSALSSNTTGNNNVALGQNSLQNNTTGNNNFALGANSLNSNVGSNLNVAIGNESGRYASGSSNIFIGGQSGQYVTGSANTIIGSFQSTAGTILDNNIILADGVGNVKAQYSGSAWSLHNEIKLTSNGPIGKVTLNFNSSAQATLSNSLINPTSIILITTIGGSQIITLNGTPSTGSVLLQSNFASTAQTFNYLIINPI